MTTLARTTSPAAAQDGPSLRDAVARPIPGRRAVRPDVSGAGAVFRRDGEIPGCREARCAEPHPWPELEAAGCTDEWARRIGSAAAAPAASAAAHGLADPADLLALSLDGTRPGFVIGTLRNLRVPDGRTRAAARATVLLAGPGGPATSRLLWAGLAEAAGVDVVPWARAGLLPDRGLLRPRPGGTELDRWAGAVRRIGEWTDALGPAAVAWAAAGHRLDEAVRLASLPPGHPARPGPDELAAMAGLAGPGTSRWLP